MNDQRLLKWLVFQSIVFVMAMTTNKTFAQFKGSYRGGSFHSAWMGVDWKSTSTRHEIKGYEPKPEQVEKYSVSFDDPLLDKLGNMCTIGGRLDYLPGIQKEFVPVDWFQGISVYLAIKPDAQLDWSGGMDQDKALHESVVLKNDGTFSVKFDLRETQRNPVKSQEFQIGISLAKHQKIGKNGASQTVVWSSNNPRLSETVRMIAIPPSPPISNELALIDKASSWPFADPDGTKLIRAVNALQPLGKQKALATLRDYTKDTGQQFNDRDIVFWIIRLLFEPVDLQQPIPPPMIGVHLRVKGDDLEEEVNLKQWPLNPIEVVDGVPFMVGNQIGMGGRPEHPISHIQWAEKFGVIRDNLIMPTANPIVAAEKLLTCKKFQALPKNNFRDPTHSIRMQAYAMLHIENRPDNRWNQISDQEWKQRLDSEEASLVWHADKQNFEAPPKKSAR